MDGAGLLWSAVVCIIYTAACYSLGTTVFAAGGLVRADKSAAANAFGLSPIARLASGFLLGQGVLANLWLYFALCGGLTQQAVAAVVMACLAGGFRAALSTRGELQSLGAALRRRWSEFVGESWPWRIAVGGCLAFLLVQGLAALVFPIPDGGDAAAFYLALPRLVAWTGRLEPLPLYERFTQIGLQGEMHFAALMTLGAGQSAKWFVWPTAVVGVALLLALGRRCGLGRRGLYLAFILVCTSTIFTRLIPHGKVDLFGAAMGLAAFYWAMHAGRSGRRAAVFVCGLFTSLAVIAKFTLAVVVPPGVLLLLVSVRKRGQIPFRGESTSIEASARREKGSDPFSDDSSTPPPLCPRLRAAAVPALIFATACLLPAAGHAVKNHCLFGQPLAPLIAAEGDPAWLAQSWLTGGQTCRLILTYPLALCVGGYPMTFGTMSFLLLAFPVLAVFIPRPRPRRFGPLAYVATAGLAGVVLWTVFRPSIFAPRYILPALLLLALPAARLAELAIARARRPRLVVALVLVGVFAAEAHLFEEIPRRVRDSVLIVSGCKSGTIDGPRGRALQAVNRAAAPGERVYVSMYQRYWLRPDLLHAANRTHEKPIGETPAERWADLYARGFCYLVIDRQCRGTTDWALDDREIDQRPPWLHFQPLHRTETVQVFRLSTAGPPVRSTQSR